MGLEGFKYCQMSSAAPLHFIREENREGGIFLHFIA